MTFPSASTYNENAVESLGSHAIVVGAGVSGLLAARVLADSFDQVTVIDRDNAPRGIRPRDGTPQSRHVHVLLEAGRALIEQLLPGFESSVIEHGGLMIDASRDLRYFHHGSFIAEAPDRLPMLSASRPLFEHAIRTHVNDIGRVDVRSGCRFLRYELHDGGITAVIVAQEETKKRLLADVVVDATGRSSRTPRWLEANGFRRPPLSEVSIDLAYGSVTIPRPPDDRRSVLIVPTPPSKRGGTIVPIEEDRWMVTLFGLHGDHPPATVEGFKSFAKSLDTPIPSRLLARGSTDKMRIDQYRFPSNRWYRYETLESMPDRLLVIGDAVASVNPIYGQGMSVAALEAMHLHDTLRDPGDSISTQYTDTVAATLRTIWRLTVSTDFGFAETSGPSPLGTTVFNWYLDRLIRTAHTDSRAADAFARVLRLERHPASLLSPTIALRVLRP